MCMHACTWFNTSFLIAFDITFLNSTGKAAKIIYEDVDTSWSSGNPDTVVNSDSIRVYHFHCLIGIL